MPNDFCTLRSRSRSLHVIVFGEDRVVGVFPADTVNDVVRMALRSIDKRDAYDAVEVRDAVGMRVLRSVPFRARAHSKMDTHPQPWYINLPVRYGG